MIVKGKPWWLRDIDTACEKAMEQGRSEVLLAPMFLGENVVYAYHLGDDGMLHLKNRKSAYATIPARWAGKDVRYSYVYGKLVSPPNGKRQFIALAVLVNGELGFNQKRNQLLELNCLQQAGFRTVLPFAKTFDRDHLTDEVIFEHYRSIREAVNQHKESIWSDATHGWFPEPVGLQAFPV